MPHGRLGGALALTPAYNQWDNSIGPTYGPICWQKTIMAAEDYSRSVMLYFELERYFYRL